jgi:hypothetical protein
MKTLTIPRTVYAALRGLLDAADISHDDDRIALRHVDLRANNDGPVNTEFTVSSLLSRSTKEGRIEIALNGQLTQMDLPKAREIVGMLHGAIEAAVSDQMMYTFLTTSIGLSDQQASAALVDFRELRQGSRETVFPS